MYRQPQWLLLPELVGLGWCKTDYPRLGGVRTDGYEGLEIGYVERGSIEWLTATGLQEAGPGSIIIDWPGDWQGGVSAIVHPCERYWVRFNFPPKGQLPGLSEETIRSLDDWFSSLESRHFLGSPVIKQHFENLIGQQRAPGSFAADTGRAAFHQIIFQVVHDYERDQGQTLSPAVEAAIAFSEGHVLEDLRIHEMAKHVNLSAGYFQELFRREVGLTPANYHLRRRIAVAKRELIYADTSITALSAELGFSSSQYFATSFKKLVGISPSDYRRLREAGSRRWSDLA